MDEFKSFKLEEINESDSTNVEEQEIFKSDLGDFTHLQDRIIKFGQSKVMLIWTILIISVFVIGSISSIIFIKTDLSLEINGESLNYNWLKIILFFTFGISLILPLAASFITYGCKNVRVDIIIKGFDMVNLFITINYILLSISTFVAFIGFIAILFKPSLALIFMGAIIGGSLYFYFKFLEKAKTFSYEIIGSFSTETSSYKPISKYRYPESIKLRPYLIVVLVLSIISWLLSFGQNNDALAQISQDLASTFDKLDLLTHATLILTIAILSISIYMTQNFDDFILIGKHNIKNDYTNEYIPKSNYEEDNWHL